MELSERETRSFVAPGPHAEYTQRLAARRTEEARQIRWEQILGNLRVSVFIPLMALAFVLFEKERVAVVAAVLTSLVAVFLTLLGLHQRVIRACHRAGRAAAFYERGLARLEDRWSGQGEPGARFLEPAHPYAADLDLFGAGSLFQLLCTARLGVGENTLAAWLCSAAAPDEIQARQTAVAELRERLDFRETLALQGAGGAASVDFTRLVEWGARPAILPARGVRLLVTGAAALAVTALVGWSCYDTGPIPLLAALVLEIGLALRLRSRVQMVVADVERRGRDLLLLAGLLALLENERFQASRLVRLQAELRITGRPPSQAIARLVFLLDWLNAKRNPYFAPLGALLLWTTQLAFALEKWRLQGGPALARWLAAVGEFEALSALASYAYENPADPFPEIVSEGPCYEGEGLGHPLIPKTTCVRNDVRFGGELRVLVVSGSNMSGKSTLLRTLGVNAVLALAGAPVRATRLRLSPLSIGATLRIQDSLQAGRSRFFAEITRVRQLVDLAKGSRPLLFLLDEIFHGTNSHDRRLGAEGVVRSLVQYGALGLITTHDLALTHIADLLAPRAVNVHFEDQFADGTITFDYRMRPGVVRQSNALALMRAVGLEV